ncbi:MAG: tryptophan-rich sensory protein [Oscillospiraceae bacterium]|nr:tryptophan-rich sensory protein [Oscillospiraceae bacterium]
MTLRAKPLLGFFTLTLGGGMLAGFISGPSMKIYQIFSKPSLSPPGFLFPIVWTVLYILMAISAYIIFTSGSEKRKSALAIFAIQLFFNFFWTVLFFNLQMYLFAFIWLAILWVLILLMIASFYRIDKTAAYLQIPYLLWVSFAGYLNFMVWVLNK